ncbi:YitT family protein [Cryptosporangium sp. NPDC051539]|uniref:membrane protein YczE n=1 Tax=Cryptosporangium sp. NPDC051539 TaxID=3363962 RepID=UPI00379E269B
MLPPDHRPRRLFQLYLGLALYGFSMALMIRANLGLDPWDAFHQGIAEHVPWSFGTVTIVVGAAVLLLWIPLRQRPGLGTISNVVVIGLAVDASLWLLPTMTWTPGRWTFMIAAILLNGVAGGCYIGAGLGPGPRDGLMTGLVRKTGGSVRVIRTGIELTVLAIGWLLGGSVGIGTIAYALFIGPVVHVTLPLLTVAGPEVSAEEGPRADDGGLPAAA